MVQTTLENEMNIASHYLLPACTHCTQSRTRTPKPHLLAHALRYPHFTADNKCEPVFLLADSSGKQCMFHMYNFSLVVAYSSAPTALFHSKNNKNILHGIQYLLQNRNNVCDLSFGLVFIALFFCCTGS